jgi:hypothetical protein
MSAPLMHACFECFKSMQECHWVALNAKCIECSQIGNDNCSYLQDPGTSANPVDESTSCEFLDLIIISGMLVNILPSPLDLKNLLKRLIALQEESRRLDVGNENAHINRTRDEHIRGIYQLLGEDISGDPSIPPLDSVISAPDAIPTSNPITKSELLAMLLALLDTTHSTSTASSRNVCSIADLTDAEFEELKSISAALDLDFKEIMSR